MLSSRLFPRLKLNRAMEKRELTFEAIGTQWSIRIESELTQTEWLHLDRLVQTRIDEFDKTYSRFRKDSIVARMAESAGGYDFPNDVQDLLTFYERLYRATDGAVTPLIGGVMSDAGYDANYSLRAKTLRRPPAWEEVIDHNGSTVTMKQPAMLDFGAAGKGYLIDILSKLLDEAIVKKYMINAGGDIIYKTAGDDYLEVGLENPLDTTEVVGLARLSNASLCASSGSRRKWGKYHHIIDPTTLESPKEVLATWVIAADTMTADGVATALFFSAPAALRKHFEFTYAVLRSDMSLEYAKDFPIQVYETTA
jgi:thiamine biosynthesis lipoprotein